MKLIFLISGYFSSADFRHYRLSPKDKKKPEIVSVRCHRRTHCWQILTKHHAAVMGMRIPVWQWMPFVDHCSLKEVKKTCEETGLKIAKSDWRALQPKDYTAEEASLSAPEEKLLTI